MFYSNQMTLGAALRAAILGLHPNGLSKDCHLSETITRFIECWRKFLGGGQEENSSPTDSEAPNDQGFYCPLPPLWRFPWEQSEEPRLAPRLSFVTGALAARPYLRRAKALVLVIMMALVLGMAGVACAQQEVAPDHFDQTSLYAPARNVGSEKLQQRVKKKIADHHSGLTARARRAGQPRYGKAGGHSTS
jgi:hypothetical protein